jgi:hypothetical protein
MRQVLCSGCGQPWRDGTYEALPASRDGEPAEWARVVRGLAGQPQASQRTIKVNDTAYPLPLTHYNCDGCDQPIVPGEPLVCVTVWMAGRPEPPTWETAYLGGTDVTRH